MRIDKYIWAIRLYKTRSLANKACATEKVLLNGEAAKASKTVKKHDIISIKVIPVWKTFKVMALPKTRVGANLIAEFTIETTSKEDLDTLNEYNLVEAQNRKLGIKGRPTKKDRRDLGNLFE